MNAWYLVTLLCLVLSGLAAAWMFKLNKPVLGWVNLVSSSANLAVLAVQFTKLGGA